MENRAAAAEAMARNIINCLTSKKEFTEGSIRNFKTIGTGKKSLTEEIL